MHINSFNPDNNPGGRCFYSRYADETQAPSRNDPSKSHSHEEVDSGQMVIMRVNDRFI